MIAACRHDFVGTARIKARQQVTTAFLDQHRDTLGAATQRQFVHTHRWRPHDLVMWDNRCTMHRGTDYDDLRWVRDMQRTTVSDIANTCEQEGVAVPIPDSVTL